jgi:DNA-binding protein H-NS
MSTYAQISKQIEALRLKAEKVKRQEVGEVIKKIRTAISAYDITPQQLFGQAAKANRKQASGKDKADRVSKYSDGTGNVWSGRGPRPHWLRAALAAGRNLSDFLATRGGAADSAPAAEPAPAKTSRKAVQKSRGRKSAGLTKAAVSSRVSYTDGEHVWSGRGPRPRWLKEAVAAGKSLDELRAP